MALPNVQRWTVRALLDGAAIEPLGAITITMESGTARIATITTAIASASFNPNVYARRSLDVFFVGLDAAGASVSDDLIYHGFVDEPLIDINSQTVTLRCTDQLQEQIASMSRAAIDALVGGHWHAQLFRADADNWTYAQDRLSTRTASLDLDVNGTARLTDWTPPATGPTFGADDYLDGSLSVDIAQAREVITRIHINFAVRTTRQWWREILTGWVYPRNFAFYLERSTTLPTKTMVQTAVNNTGWAIKTASYTELPPSGVYVVGNGPATANWIKNRDDFITDCTLRLIKRWTQTIEHQATVTLVANESLPVHLDVADTVAVTHTGTDDRAFETDFDPSEDLTGGTAAGADGFMYRDAQDATDLDAFVLAVMHQQHVRMVAAHRRNFVNFELPLVVSLDLGQLVTVTGQIDAQGMIVGLEHSIDTRTGRATTRVRLAVLRGFAPAASFTPPAVSPFIDPGAAPASTFPTRETQLGGIAGAPAYQDAFHGYVGNYDPPDGGEPLFDIRFRLGAPEVPAEFRDDASAESAAEVPVGIANQPLTLPVP